MVSVSSMIIHKSIPYVLMEEISKQCSQHRADIKIIKDGKSVDAKDIIGLITLSFHPEDKLTIISKGADSYNACLSIVKKFQ